MMSLSAAALSAADIIVHGHRTFFNKPIHKNKIVCGVYVIERKCLKLPSRFA